MSEGPAGHTPNSQVPDPVLKMGADTGVKPDCPLAEDSDDVSVTNLKVESVMNHRAGGPLFATPALQKSHSMPSARLMHTSELLKMGLPEPQTSI